MMIIGCDFHPSMQTIAWKNTETGERGRRELKHDGEAQAFYRRLQGQKVRVGMKELSGEVRARTLASMAATVGKACSLTEEKQLFLPRADGSTTLCSSQQTTSSDAARRFQY